MGEYEDRVDILMDSALCIYNVNNTHFGTFGDTTGLSLLVIPVDTVKFVRITSIQAKKANPIKEVKIVFNQGENSYITQNLAGCEYTEKTWKRN